jgi:hypothetical protein
MANFDDVYIGVSGIASQDADGMVSQRQNTERKRPTHRPYQNEGFPLVGACTSASQVIQAKVNG